MRHRSILLAAAAVVAAACSDSAGYTEREVGSVPSTTAEVGAAAAEDAGAPATTAEPSNPAAPTPGVPSGEPIVDGAANSLVIVHDRDGGADALASYRADGTKVATYSTDEDAIIWQPIWSPDGRRLAWTSSPDGTTWELVTASVDGADHSTHPLPGRPDYITFDPTASSVLALTPSPDGFGVVIVDLANDSDDAGDAPFALIDLGLPYYSDFSPQGDRLVSHVATDMRIVDVDGGLEPLGFVSGGHQAPAWHPTDDIVYFTAESDERRGLVAYDLATGSIAELASFEQFVLFDIADTGDHLAVASFAPVDPDAVNALRGAPASATPTSLTRGLWIVNTADRTTRRLSGEPTVAPMFDPTGSRVLVRTAFAGLGQWDVYDLDGNRTSTAMFDVDDTLLTGYLPFWDQYVRSQTLWSPDGRYFTHVGASQSGESGVWIHDATTSGASSFLVEGDVAFWSPT
ncbi:MAG: hypothetical protein QNJ12_09465 [Ilumatobacter sp.]|uniref:hypothetical protein n=1 Tax=Ilumatobacter sp. TaxID=1967498 RepID=UPI0026362596|nr:hypothetical protein [Ilumatobacter sp.]MDJ0769011.1 hypothetical protein [Ilumatobacter sp.]